MELKQVTVPASITPLIDTEDACFDLNASRPIAKGDLKWRDALLVAHRVNSIQNSDLFIYVGGENDAWVEDILESMPDNGRKTLKLVDCVDTVEEEHGKE